MHTCHNPITIDEVARRHHEALLAEVRQERMADRAVRTGGDPGRQRAANVTHCSGKEPILRRLATAMRHSARSHAGLAPR